jgi:hypothetical protein
MGLFDLFKGVAKKDKADDADRQKASAAAKWAERAGDKRAQAYDRQEAINALAAMGTVDAAAALLRRFTFSVDPSILDQEEKEVAFQGVVRAGKDVLPNVRSFAAKADSLAWPMRVVKDLLAEEDYVEELILWLSRWDTEYSKFIDPKLQLLGTLGEHRHEKIGVSVLPFLRDVNEGARFHAMATLLAQGDPGFLSAIVESLEDEESLRIKNKVAEAMASSAWALPEELRERMRKVLPYGFSVDGEGVIRKRGGGINPFADDS